MLWFQPHLTNQPQNVIEFKDELKRSVLLDINCQVDDTLEFTTADGYKAHLKNLNKRLKSNRRDAIYTARIIGQCLSELKHIYRGNKKLLICATKDLFSISYVYFLLNCAISPQHIIGVAHRIVTKDSSKKI